MSYVVPIMKKLKESSPKRSNRLLANHPYRAVRKRRKTNPVPSQKVNGEKRYEHNGYLKNEEDRPKINGLLNKFGRMNDSENSYLTIKDSQGY